MGKRIAIIASTKDPASINIFRRISGIGDRPLPKVNEGEIYFLVKGSTVDFIIIGCEPIFAENLDEKFSPIWWPTKTRMYSACKLPDRTDVEY